MKTFLSACLIWTLVCTLAIKGAPSEEPTDEDRGSGEQASGEPETLITLKENNEDSIINKVSLNCNTCCYYSNIMHLLYNETNGFS